MQIYMLTTANITDIIKYFLDFVECERVNLKIFHNYEINQIFKELAH